MKTTASTTQAHARNRTSRMAESRKSFASPAIQTGASTGLTSRNWNGTIAHHGCELVESPAAMERETSSCGQP